MKTIDERNYLSDEGKVFMDKNTKEIMGWGICLGDDDSIENYEEMDCPEEYKGNPEYDNAIPEDTEKESQYFNKRKKQMEVK